MRRTRTQKITDLVDVAALGCVAAGGYTLGITVGLFVTGACLLGISFTLTRKARRR